MKKFKLEEICSYITDGSHYSPESVDIGKPIASVKDMHDYGINIDSCRIISIEEFNKLERSNCKPVIGDILIAKDGSYLKHAFVVESETDYVILSSIGLFRPNTEIVNPYYLKYLFLNKKFRDYVTQGFVSGTALKRIVLKAFKRIDISIPDIQTQDEIVYRIKPLDSKIRANLALINYLEEYLQHLFHKWFIDYNFPDENGNPYKDSGGEMVGVGGKILPKSWMIIPLNDSIEFINGIAMQKFPPKNNDDLLPVIKIKEISNNGFGKDTEYVTNSIDKNLIINDGDILFPWSGSLSVNVWTGGMGGLNQHIFKVQSKEFEKWFILLWIKQHMRYFEQIAYGKKTTMGHINRKHLGYVSILVPDEMVMTRMNRIMTPLYEKVVQLNIENRTLIELRNLLIQKLIK